MNTMVDVLENKRAATRFRILVAIAERQPAVSQGEIADLVGVTSQAVSEYIRELITEGLVEKQGRSHYRVTKEGVDWMMNAANTVKQFADHVTEDVLGNVQVDAAIALEAIRRDEEVTLSIIDGFLHATPGSTGSATGVATGAASAGEDVGVTGFEGIIDLEPEPAIIVQIPSIRAGGSRNVDTEVLTGWCQDADVVVAQGVEAIVACRKASIEPDTVFGAGAVIGEAANRGLNGVAITTADAIGRLADSLRDANVAYEVVDVG